VVTITAPPAGGSATAGTNVTLAASAHDDFDGDLGSAIVWRSSRDGVLGTGASITTNRLGVGVHTLTASVTDSDGAPGSAQTTITTRRNPPPGLPLALPADGAVCLGGKPLLLAATAIDAEDGDLGAAVTWSSSRDGVLGTGARRVVPGLTVGTHVLTAAV